jgi:hypothetical protein
MTAAMFFLTAAVCWYLAICLHAAKVEIADLRTSIARLKKRLKQRS